MSKELELLKHGSSIDDDAPQILGDVDAVAVSTAAELKAQLGCLLDHDLSESDVPRFYEQAYEEKGYTEFHPSNFTERGPQDYLRLTNTVHLPIGSDHLKSSQIRFVPPQTIYGTPEVTVPDVDLRDGPIA